MYQLSFINEAIAGLLFSGGCGKNLRPQFRRFHKGVETINTLQKNICETVILKIRIEKNE